jgi:hypothetical protein
MIRKESLALKEDIIELENVHRDLEFGRRAGGQGH